MWFRIHTDVIHHPVVWSLPAPTFKAWLGILCLAKDGDGLVPTVKEIAFKLRCGLSSATRWTDELVDDYGLLLRNDDGTFQPKNWDKHQYRSDNVTERVRAFRERKRNVSETPSETDTETETEQSVKPLASAAAEIPKRRPAPASMGTRISIEALPDEWAEFALNDCGMDRQRAEREFAEFRDYWLSVAGAKGRKADWFATWRNRLRNVPSRDGPKPGAFNFQPHESATDRAIRIGHERIRETGRL